MAKLIYASIGEAREMIRTGKVPDGLYVQGHLDLSHDRDLTEIPEGFRGCHTLTLDGCKNLRKLPDRLEVNRLSVVGCKKLHKLPAHLKCDSVLAMSSGISEIPPTIRVRSVLSLNKCLRLKKIATPLPGRPSLYLTGCRNLQALPANLTVNSLTLDHCAMLESLPEGLDCNVLDARRSGISAIDHPITVHNEVKLQECQFLTSVTGIQTCGVLNLHGCPNLTTLADNLHVRSGLNVTTCPALTRLPAGLSVGFLLAGESGLETVPADIKVRVSIDLSACPNLRELPAGLVVRRLSLDNCHGLTTLPDDLHVIGLSAINCTNLTTWGSGGPFTATINDSRLVLRGCTRLTHLPEHIRVLGRVDVSDCPNLRQLPTQLETLREIELADSGLTSLPPGPGEVNIFWRGVRVNAQIAFRPETITYRDVLAEENTEVRRIMIDRMGYDRFFAAADPTELDKDADAGGERRLLWVDVRPEESLNWRDEPIVCLAVACPSTGHRYLLRVPPFMRTCHQAAAWLAGFEDPDLYQPVAEA